MAETPLTTLFDNAVLRAVRRQAEAAPQQPAIISTGGQSVTYEDLWRQIAAYGNGFSSRLSAGDRVLILVKPGVRAVACIFGIIAAGGVPVLCDTAMGRELFASRVRQAKPRLIIAEPALLLIRRLPGLQPILYRLFSELPDVGQLPDKDDGASWLSPKDCYLPPAGTITYTRRQPDAELVVVFTSGTTGNPKGVVHTTTSIESLITTTSQMLTSEYGQRLYSSQLYLIVPALARGLTTVIPKDAQPSARQLAGDLERFAVNQLFAAPAQLHDLLTYLNPRQQRLPAALRCIMAGSAPVTKGFLARLTANFDGDVWCVYGMTEQLPVAIVNGRDKLAYHGDGDLLGTAVPGVRLRRGSDGELFVSGPAMCRGYLDGPVNEIATGDLVQLDGRRLVLLGRKKDMIIRREFNIYPALYESTISTIPGVLACAMVGRYVEAMADEQVVLFVEAGTVTAGNGTGAAAKPERPLTADRLLEQLRHGPYSIDHTALPDEIRIGPIPRVGRQLKPDKQKLREMAVQ